MKRTFYIAIFSICLNSCIPEPLVVDDVPVAGEKLVVSTVLGSEQVLSLILTRSYGALEVDLKNNSELIENYVVSDAEVWVRYNNEIVKLDQLVPGVYGTNNIDLNTDATYELEVYDPKGNRTVTSQTELKENVRFNDVSVEIFNSFDTSLQVSYSFNDVPGESYYMVNVQKLSERQLDPERILRNRVYTHLVTDIGFPEGSEITGNFLTYFRYLSYGDTLLLSLSNISSDYYNYLEKVNNGFLGPGLINEPFNFPTNVKNGYGFFNLYFRDSKIRTLYQ